MAYRLSQITLRSDNTMDGIGRVEEAWRDVASGKLPILFDSEMAFQPGISPISRYSNYESDEKGQYDLTIMGVTTDFFAQMELEAVSGTYRKYDAWDDGGNLGICTKKAWEKVWEDQKTGAIKRAFTVDYESSVPAGYTKDGKAHCYLYISVTA